MHQDRHYLLNQNWLFLRDTEILPEMLKLQGSDDRGGWEQEDRVVFNKQED